MEVPDWNAVYKDATLPLMVDIGSGKSLFTSFDIRSDVLFFLYLRALIHLLLLSI